MCVCVCVCLHVCVCVCVHACVCCVCACVCVHVCVYIVCVHVCVCVHCVCMYVCVHVCTCVCVCDHSDHPHQKPDEAPSRKRLSSEGVAPAAKKKLTPISFDLPTDPAASKRQSRAVYQPPKNTYSKNIEAPADSGDGLGRGWGRRGRARGGRGTWKV